MKGQSGSRSFSSSGACSATPSTEPFQADARQCRRGGRAPRFSSRSIRSRRGSLSAGSGCAARISCRVRADGSCTRSGSPASETCQLTVRFLDRLRKTAGRVGWHQRHPSGSGVLPALPDDIPNADVPTLLENIERRVVPRRCSAPAAVHARFARPREPPRPLPCSHQPSSRSAAAVAERVGPGADSAAVGPRCGAGRHCTPRRGMRGCTPSACCTVREGAAAGRVLSAQVCCTASKRSVVRVNQNVAGCMRSASVVVERYGQRLPRPRWVRALQGQRRCRPRRGDPRLHVLRPAVRRGGRVRWTGFCSRFCSTASKACLLYAS